MKTHKGPLERGRRFASLTRAMVLAALLASGGAALADVGQADSPSFTLNTIGVSPGVGGVASADSVSFLLDTRPYWGPFFAGPSADSGLFTLDTTALSPPGLIAGNVAIYPTVSYSPSSGTLTMAARVIDPLYGNVSSGSFGWTLEMAGLGAISAGAGSYNSGVAQWQASAVYGSGLTPGDFTVRFSITTDRGRQGSASLPLTVGTPSVVVNGMVKEAASHAPLAGAQVALFAAAGANGLWTLVNAQYSGVVPPLSTLLTKLTPIRPVATTGPDGTFSWPDVPVADSYVLVAAKSGYQQQYSSSFHVTAAGKTVTHSFTLAAETQTLAALAAEVADVSSRMEDLLKGNAATAGTLSEQYYEDDIYDAGYDAQDWFNLAGDLLGAAAGGAKVVEAGVKPVTKAVLRKMRAEVLKESAKAVAEYVLRQEVEWIHDLSFPRDGAAYLQSAIHTYFLDALRQTSADFVSTAASYPLADGFSKERVVELGRGLSDSVGKVMADQDRYLLSPQPAGPIYGFTLSGMSDTYMQASHTYDAMEAATVALSSVQIAGGAIILGGAAVAATGVGAPVGGAAAGIAVTATAAAGYGKTAIAVAEEPLKLCMLVLFTHAICGSYPCDNSQAAQVYGDFVSLLVEESVSPFYLHARNRFDSTVEIALQDSWPAGVLWAIGGLPGLDVAQGTATVTVHDQSVLQGVSDSVTARCVSYSVWTPITLRSLFGAEEAALRTSSDVRGPVEVPVSGRVEFQAPYRGYSKNFLSQFKPHYLVVESSIGPWKAGGGYTPFFVLAPGEILRPVSAAARFHVTSAEVIAPASSASGQIRAMSVSGDVTPVIEDVLTASAPVLTNSFVAGTNLWAIDLRLFAPADAAVSLLVTDSQGHRLGYSDTNGLTYCELTGTATKMSERPISLRLFQPPAGETYTVTVALLTPGPQPVQVALFEEIEELSGALLVANPSRVVVDLATGAEPRVDVQVLEGSQQQPLTNVTATLTNLVRWDGTASLTLLTNATQTLGDIGAGESTSVGWPLLVPETSEHGKYVSTVRLSSGQTVDLLVPVVVLVRQTTNIISLMEGTNADSGILQKTAVIGSDGAGDTWLYIPKGYTVMHANLGMAPGSTNVQSPTLDVGADGSVDWSFSGRFDVGLHVDGLEPALNNYILTHASGTNGFEVPLRVRANPGESVLLGGLQLYLEAVPNELRSPQVLPGGQVQFDLLCQPGFTYRVEFSANLSSWSTLDTVLATDSVMRVTDSTASGSEQRFYRAVLE